MSASGAARAPGGIALIEEAVHLLRQAEPATWAIYYAGTAPFALGLLYFWAHTTWFTPPAAAIAWEALGLVALFAAMKTAHAEFCARLHARRLGGPPAALSLRRGGRVLCDQFRVQAWGLFVLPVTLLAGVPFGWTYAYFQSVSAMSDEEAPGRHALAQAALWPAQNHAALALLAALSLSVLANLVIAFWAVPWLANRLLGIENLFALGGWDFANTTFLSSVCMLTWLAVDPLVKAFYTLRVFYGRSWRTGEDVRVELRTARRPQNTLRATAAGAMLVFVLAIAPDASGAESSAPPQEQPVSAPELDRAIERVLSSPGFEWRMRPLPQPVDEANEGPVKRFLRTGVESVMKMLKWCEEVVKEVFRWFERLFPDKTSPAMKLGGGGGMTLLQVLMYVFMAAVVILLLVLIGIVLKRRRTFARSVVQATAVMASAPDLRDERTQAAQLPPDGWLALAREQLAKGEWRLAWRALYLATLARLAAEGLLSLAQFKTNLDYERELRRRAVAREEIVTRFSTRRRAYEAVWYGRGEADETSARNWLAELGGAPS